MVDFYLIIKGVVNQGWQGPHARGRLQIARLEGELSQVAWQLTISPKKLEVEANFQQVIYSLRDWKLLG